MWSFVQRRQIAKQIQSEYQISPNSIEKQNYKSRNSLPLSSDDQVNRQDSPSDRAFKVQGTGEDDPLNPKNWPLATRSRNIFIICFLVFTQCWSGAADSIGNDMASKDLHVSQVAENVSTAVFLFGIGTGALFTGPLSETVGRNPTYLVATACYLFFVLGSAMAPTFGGQVVCRYFVGLSASATLTINGASVNDQFRPVKKALVFPIVAWANIAGKQAHLNADLSIAYCLSTCDCTSCEWLDS